MAPFSPDYLTLCIDAGGHEELQAPLITNVISDASAGRSAFVRVIDDSGKDYLYPAVSGLCFVPVHSKGREDALRVMA